MKRQYFKLNEDDILGIVSDYLSTQVAFETFDSKLQFIENEQGDYRIIAAYGELEDEGIASLDFEKLDEELDFNGERSMMKTGIDRNSPEVKQMIEKWQYLIEEDD